MLLLRLCVQGCQAIISAKCRPATNSMPLSYKLQLHTVCASFLWDFVWKVAKQWHSQIVYTSHAYTSLSYKLQLRYVCEAFFWDCASARLPSNYIRKLSTHHTKTYHFNTSSSFVTCLRHSCEIMFVLGFQAITLPNCIHITHNHVTIIQSTASVSVWDIIVRLCDCSVPGHLRCNSVDTSRTNVHKSVTSLLHVMRLHRSL